MKSLAVIDGKSIFYRGYYAMPDLSLPDGTPTGGVYGFASIAIELIKKLEPDYVAVAWDKPKTNIRKRREIYPEYKAGRKPAPPDFYAQVPILMELLDAFGWPFYELDDYEADDILGTFAKQATAKGVETYLLTSDLDALQLIGPMTKVYAIKNGLSNIEEFDIPAFEHKYGIKVSQFLDLKSLKGDSSDNLPGVPGVGEKTAIQLLQQYDNLDNIYANIDEIKPTIAKKLIAGKDLAYMSKEVGKIWTDAPVELDWGVADVEDTNLAKVAEILDRLQFRSLKNRLPGYMKTEGEPVKHSPDVAPLTVVDWPDTLTVEGPVFVEFFDGRLWVSLRSGEVCVATPEDIPDSFWTVVSLTTVVSYDIKALLHLLSEVGVKVKLDAIYDLKQASFLIDPLRRDRTIAGLTMLETTDRPTMMAGLRQVYESQQKQLDNLPKVRDIAYNYDFPLSKLLFKMERRGVKLDVKKLAQLSRELGDEYKKLEQEIYNSVGVEFNIASPTQLSEILFTKLQLPTTGIKKGKKGYSTGQAELDKLRGQHPIIELIERTRELAKLKNTYVDALPKLVDDNFRVHTTFNQDVAATGRLSSTNPNLQNIPIRSEQGRKIRQAFVAEEGNVLVSADYSQFELRLAAALAGDDELIEDFNNSVDIHTKTASEVYGIPLEGVSKDQRRAAKVINFGVLYGMSPHGLSVATGMSVADAKAFIDKYFTLRAPIRAFIDEVVKKARTDGYVETYYGRRRPTPDIHSSNYVVRTAAERAAANMPIQGTEADLMKRAMLRVEERLGDAGWQVLQIHDSILIECPEDKSDTITSMLVDVMENIAPELPVRLDVDVHVGKDWGDL